MTRDQLEHVIRAAAAITKELSFVVIGSQAVLLPYPDAHPDLLVSRELDLIVVMLKEGMISPATLEQRIRQLEPKRPIKAIVAWAQRRAEEAKA